MIIMIMLWQSGETALHVACREDLLSVTQALCSSGCNVEHQNKVSSLNLSKPTTLHYKVYHHLAEAHTPSPAVKDATTVMQLLR